MTGSAEPLLLRVQDHAGKASVAIGRLQLTALGATPDGPDADTQALRRLGQADLARLPHIQIQPLRHDAFVALPLLRIGDPAAVQATTVETPFAGRYRAIVPADDPDRDQDRAERCRQGTKHPECNPAGQPPHAPRPLS